MKNARGLARRCAAASLWLASAAAPHAASAHSVHVLIDGPTVVVFLPTDAQPPSVEGASELIAHAGFALADLRRCLANKAVRIRKVFAEHLSIEYAGASQTFDLLDAGQGVGAVLAQPGRDAILVLPQTGASALQHLLPQAAFEYWHVTACKRE